MIGAEALIRWHSRRLGWISPAEFIPIAESTGQISAITAWVIAAVLEQLNAWAKIDPAFAVAVNISPAELENPDFVQQLQSQLAAAGISPKNFELEITERGIAHDLPQYLDTLKRLQASRVQIKLDDFGAGYAGLSSLLQLRFDAVKVDRALMPKDKQDRDRLAVSLAVAVISRHLDFDLVAEGIETSEQLELMQALEYGYGQGYYLCKPVTAEQITKMLGC